MIYLRQYNYSGNENELEIVIITFGLWDLNDFIFDSSEIWSFTKCRIPVGVLWKKNEKKKTLSAYQFSFQEFYFCEKEGPSYSIFEQILLVQSSFHDNEKLTSRNLILRFSTMILGVIHIIHLYPKAFWFLYPPVSKGSTSNTASWRNPKL